MELEDYIPLAMRTNKDRDTISVNPQMVVNVLALFIASGNMLDQIKKHVFYGREYNTEKFNIDYQKMIHVLQHMIHIRINGTSEEMGEEDVNEINPHLFHAIIGIATESTELCEGLYKVLTNEQIDLVNLREENGDLNWYQALFYDTMKKLGYEGTWGDDLEKNIAKLKARYPDEFTNEKALNRNTEKEREILER